MSENRFDKNEESNIKVLFCFLITDSSAVYMQF